MAQVLVTNFAYSTLQFGITSGQTTITVASGHGARFPAPTGGDWFYVVVEDASLNREIMKCTSRTVDVLTVTRAQEGTTAQAFSAASVSLRITAQTFADATSVVNTTNVVGSGTISGTATGVTKAYGTADTTMATTAFVDALRDVPANSQSGDYTFALTDRGKSVDYTGTGGNTFTIPANAAVAFPIGTVITVSNLTANNLTLAITSDTLRQAGLTATGPRTIGNYGVATMRKVAATTWIVSGAGVT